MINKPEFYGSVTVGERGQISIPSKIRDKLDITAGDKMLVFSGPTGHGMFIVKSDIMNEIMTQMTDNFQAIMEQVENDKEEVKMPTKGVGNFVAKRPVAIVLLVIIITAILGSFMTQINFETEMDSFDPQSEVSVANGKVSEQFGSESMLVQVIIESRSGNVLSKDSLRETLQFEWAIENNTAISDTFDNSTTPVQGHPDMIYGLVAMMEGITQIEGTLMMANSSVNSSMFEMLTGMVAPIIAEADNLTTTLTSGANDTYKQGKMDAFLMNASIANATIGAMLGGIPANNDTPPIPMVTDIRQMQLKWLNGTNDTEIVSTVQDAFTYDNTHLKNLGQWTSDNFHTVSASANIASAALNNASQRLFGIAMDPNAAPYLTTPALTIYGGTMAGVGIAMNSTSVGMAENATIMLSLPDIGENVAGFTAALPFLFSGDFSNSTVTANASMILIYQDPELTNEELMSGQENLTTLAADFQTEEITLMPIAFLVFMEKINESAMGDLAFLGPIVVTFVLVVLLINYRSVQDVILSLLALMLSIIWVFGIAGALGYSFNIMLIAVPLILMGLGIDYAIHLIMRYREELRRGDTIKGASKVSILTVGGALALTTVTTMIGFLSNTTSSIGPIATFGILTAIGIAAALFIMVTFVPAVKIILDSRREKKGKKVIGMKREGEKEKAGKVEASGMSAVNKFLGASATAAEKHPYKLLTIVAVLTIIGGYAALQLETEFDIMDFLPEDLDESKAIVYLMDNFEFSDEYAYIYVEGNMSDTAVLQEIASTGTRTLDDRGVTNEVPISPASVLMEMAQEGGDDREYNATITDAINTRDSDGDHLPDRDLSALYDIIRSDDTAWSRLSFVLHHNEENGDYDSSVLRVKISASANSEISAMIEDVEADIVPLEGTSGVDSVTLTGGAVVQVETMDEINYNQIRSLMLTIVLSFIVLTVALFWMDKSLALGPITMVPIVLVIVWMWGSMYFLGYTLNVMTNMVAALSVGLGLDYAVHVTHRFKEEIERHDDIDLACRESVSHTGSALTGAAVTTMGAFGILAFSSLTPMRVFGIIVALAVLYGYLSSVFVLPTLLVIWAKRNKKKAARKEEAVNASSLEENTESETSENSMTTHSEGTSGEAVNTDDIPEKIHEEPSTPADQGPLHQENAELSQK